MTDPGADNTLQGRRVLVVEDELLVAMELDSVLRAGMHGARSYGDR